MATAPVIPIQTPRLALWQIIETIDAYVDTLELIESDAERIEAEAELDSYLSQLARKVDTTTEFLDFIEARREIRKKQVQRLESSNRRDQAIIDRIERSIHARNRIDRPRIARGRSLQLPSPQVPRVRRCARPVASAGGIHPRKDRVLRRQDSR